MIIKYDENKTGKDNIKTKDKQDTIIQIHKCIGGSDEPRLDHNGLARYRSVMNTHISTGTRHQWVLVRYEIYS